MSEVGQRTVEQAATGEIAPEQAEADQVVTEQAAPEETQADGRETPADAGTDTIQPADGEPAGRRNPRRWWLAALAVIVIAGTATGTGFELRAHSIRSESAAQNRALSDTGATTEVIGQVGTALTKVLSYDYAHPAATEQAAQQFLTGDAASQYRTLFTALQQKAPGEKLTLTAKVVSTGVTSLHGDTAQLLVFLDQSSVRASDRQSSASAAQLDVTAVRRGNSWKISELRPL